VDIIVPSFLLPNVRQRVDNEWTMAVRYQEKPASLLGELRQYTTVARRSQGFVSAHSCPEYVSSDATEALIKIGLHPSVARRRAHRCTRRANRQEQGTPSAKSSAAMWCSSGCHVQTARLPHPWRGLGGEARQYAP